MRAEGVLPEAGEEAAEPDDVGEAGVEGFGEPQMEPYPVIHCRRGQPSKGLGHQ
jgi:hypothetical protein